MPEKKFPIASAVVAPNEADDVEIGQGPRLLSPDTERSDSVPNEQSQVNTANGTEKEHMPFFTVLVVVINLSAFCYGLFFMIGRENTEISEFSPISPPNEKLTYATVSTWPGKLYNISTSLVNLAVQNALTTGKNFGGCYRTNLFTLDMHTSCLIK